MSAKGNSKGGSKGGAPKVPMTPERASAIQSKTMKTTGTVKTKSFAARAQHAAAINVNEGVVTASRPKRP